MKQIGICSNTVCSNNDLCLPNYTGGKLMSIAQVGKPCISCGRMLPLQAGHYLPAGKYPTLRFNEDNVHGQCAECNIGKYGNIEYYRNSLIARIGYDRVRMLEMEAENYKKENGIKFSVEDYAYIAKKYKEKIKNRDFEKDN